MDRHQGQGLRDPFAQSEEQGHTSSAQAGSSRTAPSGPSSGAGPRSSGGARGGRGGGIALSLGAPRSRRAGPTSGAGGPSLSNVSGQGTATAGKGADEAVRATDDDALQSRM